MSVEFDIHTSGLTILPVGRLADTAIDSATDHPGPLRTIIRQRSMNLLGEEAQNLGEECYYIVLDTAALKFSGQAVLGFHIN